MVKSKSWQIIWDEEAKLYLKAAIRYIKEESPQGAEKVKKEILGNISTLAKNPLMFESDRLRTNNDGSYRAFAIYHYRITYKVTKEAIYIVRIRHTSQEPLEH